jgi:phosphoglycolate phosphatase-like HAD superfamily hydrolase
VDEPLSLWKDTPTRREVLEFISSVTCLGSTDFVPPAERIATFDNDGTLWCEKPAYIQLIFALQRLKDLAAANPGLLEQPSYKAATSNDIDYFDSLYHGNLAELRKLLFDTHAGMTQEEFEVQAFAFLSKAIHPRYGVPYKQMTYQPMIELIRYLEAHDFKVFIATAGGMSFVRTVSEEIYGISRERVIGSNTTFET